MEKGRHGPSTPSPLTFCYGHFILSSFPFFLSFFLSSFLISFLVLVSVCRFLVAEPAFLVLACFRSPYYHPLLLLLLSVFEIHGWTPRSFFGLLPGTMSCHDGGLTGHPNRPHGAILERRREGRKVMASMTMRVGGCWKREKLCLREREDVARHHGD